MCGIANMLPTTKVTQCMMKSAIERTMTAILPQLFPLNNAQAMANSIATRIPTPTAINPAKTVMIFPHFQASVKNYSC